MVLIWCLKVPEMCLTFHINIFEKNLAPSSVAPPNISPQAMTAYDPNIRAQYNKIPQKYEDLKSEKIKTFEKKWSLNKYKHN